jgi:hypothetical protein
MNKNSRIRIQDPDPLVRSMDPRIRIRIHPKMSWIRNTAAYILNVISWQILTTIMCSDFFMDLLISFQLSLLLSFQN